MTDVLYYGNLREKYLHQFAIHLIIVDLQRKGIVDKQLYFKYCKKSRDSAHRQIRNDFPDTGEEIIETLRSLPMKNRYILLSNIIDISEVRNKLNDFGLTEKLFEPKEKS